MAINCFRNPFFRKKRPIVLLEVLIAFALIALCALPLIYPHVVILRSERAFLATVELDHLVNLLYADRLEKLYLNQIPWPEIQGGKGLPIEESLLRQVGFTGSLPYTGSYRFIEKRHKPPEPAEKAIYLFDLVFTFVEKKGFFPGNGEKTLTYTYNVMIERRQK